MGSLAMVPSTPRASRERNSDAPSAVAGEARQFGDTGVVALAGKSPDVDLRQLLERDGVLVVQTDPFRLTDSEFELIDRHWSDGRSKNSSYNPNTGRTVGVVGAQDVVAGLGAVMARYAEWSHNLIAEFFPPYHGTLEMGRTSLRRRSVQDEPPLSRRKDDRSLHLDAFTSQPVAGRRILRVFSNIHPMGGKRVWHVGEPFEDVARKFVPKARKPLPLEPWLFETLGVTRGRRSDLVGVRIIKPPCRELLRHPALAGSEQL